MKFRLFLALAVLTVESQCYLLSSIFSNNVYSHGLRYWLERLKSSGLSGLNIEYVVGTHNRQPVIIVHINKHPHHMDANSFFKQARTLAFNSYSNYMCSVSKPPRTNSHNSRRRGVKPGLGFGVRGDWTRKHDYKYYPSDRLCKVAGWLQKQNPLWYQHRYQHRRHHRYYYRYKRFFYNSNYYDKNLSDEDPTVILDELRSQLLRGFEPTKLSELKGLLNKHLMTDDFDQVIKKIYGNHVNKVKTSTESMLPFYVKEENSTTQGLMDADLRKLLLDVIATANAMNPQCTSWQCDIDHKEMEDMHNKQMNTSLPIGMNATQKEQAMKGMEFFIKSKMDSDKTKGMLSSFTQGYMNDNTNAIVVKRQSGSISSFIDVGAVCFAWKTYFQGSSYCGLQYIARQLYTYLNCDKHILQPSKLDPTPAPKTTTTTTTTTTTAPTTSTSTTTTSTTTTPTTTEEPAKPPPQCGISELLTRTNAAEKTDLVVIPFIVGGHLAGDCRAYPWLARLVVDSKESCGGVILDEMHILTAAHCAYQKNTVKVYVGEYDTVLSLGQEQIFDINIPADVSIHPDFSYFGQTDDMAVLKLPRPIDLSLPCAKPVCLDPNFKVVDGMKCNVAGWGAVDENNLVASRFLRAVTVPVYNGPKCMSTFNSRPLTNAVKQYCAGNPVAGGVDSCAGDSGGPLLCQKRDQSWVAVGVTSYGIGCGQKTSPGVYANVALYYDWIQDQLKK